MFNATSPKITFTFTLSNQTEWKDFWVLRHYISYSIFSKENENGVMIPYIFKTKEEAEIYFNYFKSYGLLRESNTVLKHIESMEFPSGVYLCQVR